MSQLQLFFNNTFTTVKALQLFHVFRFGVAFLIGIVLVKWGIPLSEFSKYEYFLFLSSLVSFFWTNGILKSMMSLYRKYNIQEQKSLLVHVSILLMGFGLLMSLIFLGLYFWFPKVLTIENPILIVLYFFFSSIGAMGELILVLRDKAVLLLRYGLIIYFLQFVILISTILWSGRIEHIFMGLVSWAVLRFTYSMYLLFKHGTRVIKWKKITWLLVFSLPLIGESLMGDAMKYVDGGLVKYFFEEESYFAIYRTGARELPFSIIVIGAIGTALIPVMSQNLKDGMTMMRNEISKVMHWLFPLSIVLMLLSPILFPIVYDEHFTLSSAIFNIYLMLIVSRVLMPHIILLSVHENYLLLWASLAELILNFGLSLLLLHFFGLLGIPLASLLAFIVIKLFMIGFIRKKYQISLSAYIDLKLYFSYTVALVVSYFIANIYI